MKPECGYMGALEDAKLARVLLEDCTGQNCCSVFTNACYLPNPAQSLPQKILLGAKTMTGSKMHLSNMYEDRTVVQPTP